MSYHNAFDAVFSSARSTSSIRHLSKKSANLRRFNRTLPGRAATNSASLLATLIHEEDGLNDAAFNSANGIGGLNNGMQKQAFSTLGHMIEGLLEQALTRRKITTQIFESERSKQTQKLWNSSRSDQDAMLARMVQHGMVEL